ncbi:PREDICTED: G-protein coupled receptor 15 [Gekko japonicus]|uniref:G-protein coupled receptor 15 n=1 Tax=Gekko japonicus TaxID=146911 RepID=A0ABM1K5S4_GEKJA|nr:PREDICTED: G-protein coupled receptor 15 [Gekko japonicus]
MEESTVSYYDDFFSTEAPDDNCPPVQLPYKNIFLPALYATVFLVGIAGNTLLMGALIFKRGIQRLIDIFIVNLAASDFVFLITLPFWVDKEMSSGLWRSGLFICKGSSYIISVNMYCSIFLLTCMSADRYLAIMHPSVARRIRTKLYSATLCICVWILSCLLGLPTLLSRELGNYDGNTYCEDKKATFTDRIGSLLLLVLAFFFPLLSILLFYCSITKKLCIHYKKSGKHNKKLKKSIKVVFVVVIAFVFSWAPYNIFKFLSLVSGIQELKPPFCLIYKVAYLGMELSGPFAFANSCTNPFIYYFFDDYIRRAMVQCMLPCVKASSLGTSSDSTDTRLSYSLTVHGEDVSRRRRRSLSL